MTNPHLSALDIAQRLGLKNLPTPEQEAIIELPPVPRLVVAGAGSGKTATMVDRVVWLVANGYCRADQILGVTFTRKAAGELRERMRSRLETLRRQNLIETDPEAGVADPVVLTYHSYANTLVKNYGLRLGIEQDVQMLGAAQSYQLVAQLVERLDPRLLSDQPPAKSTIISGVLALAGECAEHLVAPETVIAESDRLIDQLEAIPKPGTVKNINPIIKNLQNKKLYAELARRYQNLKKNMQVMDFGDLLSSAVNIAQNIKIAGEEERAKYKVVLLDEFQDTSHAQMQLFSALYGKDSGISGYPVMAVGDPKQSIYGFRGASDGQLFGFYDYFPAEDRGASYLTTAWRNDSAILDAANQIAQPLAKPADYVRATSQVTVPDLAPRPQVAPGKVEMGQFLTDTEEARWVAQTISARRTEISNRQTEKTDATEPMPTMAVLCRTKSGMGTIRTALEEFGVPYQVVGLGGLLDTPEIVDMLAYLRVLADPGRSDALMRILSGARWRLGVADLLAFSDWASHLERVRKAEIQTGITADLEVLYGSAPSVETGENAASRSAQSAHDLKKAAAETPNLQAEIRARLESMEKRAEADATDHASLIEALETLPKPGWTSSKGRTLTDTAWARLSKLREEIAYLRDFMADDLGVLLLEIERTILLDIELAAKPGVQSHLARRNLDAFHEVAAQFLLSAPRLAASVAVTPEGEIPEDEEDSVRFSLSASSGSATGVNAFLAWLDVTVGEEAGLEMAAEEPRADAVQILTVHASKGLEWDQVYIPFMVEGDFPSTKDSRWTQHAEKLPWTIRGDSAYLPMLQTGVTDRREFDEMADIFKQEGEEHALADERRLAYVGVTRARSLLVLTSSVWKGSSQKPKEPAVFVQDLFAPAQDGEPFHFANPQVPLTVVNALDPEEIGAENPQSVALKTALWPFDPIDGPEIQTWESLEALTENKPQPSREPKTVENSRRARLERAAQNVRRGGIEQADEPAVITETRAEDAAITAWEEETKLLLGILNEPVTHHRFELPGHVSASDMVALSSNAEAVVENLRRPMPARPGIAARVGDIFHAWVEQHFDAAAQFDFEDEAFDDDEVDEALNVDELKERFLASEWAERIPWQVEYPLETPLVLGARGEKDRQITVRGRVDAIFRSVSDTGEVSWELVDWKTGRVPSAREMKHKSVQLALYRLAFAKHMDVDPENITGVFYYVASGETKRLDSTKLLDEEGLLRLLKRAQKLGRS